MTKLKVYVHSFELPTTGFVDKEGAMHACAQAQKSAFQGLELHTGLFGQRYLSDEDREALMRVDKYCKDNGVGYEIVDVGRMHFWSKLGLRVKGIKPPALSWKEKTLCGVPSEEDIRSFLKG